MFFEEIIGSLSAALLIYQGKTGKYVKQKNKIAKRLLLTAIQTQSRIQVDLISTTQQKMTLYNMLLFSQDALSKLNKEGELDSIVNFYIKKWDGMERGCNYGIIASDM